MSVTAHRITHTFHVSMDDTFSLALATGEELKTELFEIITTESLLPITQEKTERRVHILRAHKVGHNTFIATNRGWE